MGGRAGGRDRWQVAGQLGCASGGGGFLGAAAGALCVALAGAGAAAGVAAAAAGGSVLLAALGAWRSDRRLGWRVAGLPGGVGDGGGAFGAAAGLWAWLWLGLGPVAAAAGGSVLWAGSVWGALWVLVGPFLPFRRAWRGWWLNRVVLPPLALCHPFSFAFAFCSPASSPLALLALLV